jgi:hypothetical protein
VIDLYGFFICAHCRASSAAEITPDAAGCRNIVTPQNSIFERMLDLLFALNLHRLFVLKQAWPHACRIKKLRFPQVKPSLQI